MYLPFGSGPLWLQERARDADSYPVETAVLQQQSGARVIDLDPRVDPRFDEYVRRQRGATAFHLPDWGTIMRNAYGYRPAYLALEEPSGDLPGVLPLFLPRGLMSRRRYRVPAVAMTSAGPLAMSAAGEAALLQ